MGLHLPGAAFIHPNTPLRDALTEAAARRVLEITDLGENYAPVGWVVDERAIVNGIVGLLATGGSTNHTIHLVAIAQAAGILINWDDFSDLSAEVPLLAKIYPNGARDVNHFHSAGGMGFLIGQLLDAGLLHDDTLTVAGPGLDRYREEPYLDDGRLAWRPAPAASADESVLRPLTNPFSAEGGLKLLTGNLGRAVIKTSAVKPEHWRVEAPAIVFNTQEELMAAFDRGELRRDFVAVVRYQGPQANGMPELHKLTPPLGVLQDDGFKVALVTDGRMSGASGKVPAAIHLTPESLGRRRLWRRSAPATSSSSMPRTACFRCASPPTSWRSGQPEAVDLTASHFGLGRELFAMFRANAAGAEQGAMTYLPDQERKSPGLDRCPVGTRPGSLRLCATTRRHDHAGDHAHRAGHPGHRHRERGVPPCRWPARWWRAACASSRSPCARRRLWHRSRRSPARCRTRWSASAPSPGRKTWSRQRQAGATFAVSPGLTPLLAQAAAESGLPLLPGTMTPSDVIAALAAGYRQLKLFPAQQAGGIGMLKAMAGPFPDVVFCPTGGIKYESAPDFLALPNVACVGGSWLTPQAAVAAGDWAAITDLARQASALRGRQRATSA